MMYNWTEEQKSAIEAFGEPVIVSAAAGSGKTAVLVERTIGLLCDSEKKIPADTLLAVTFTNDAASQMSQKLSREIDARAELDPDNPWIQRQQALLRLAEITTINAFCYNLVKENISQTEFRSGLRILEENEAAMLCDRALTAVLEREYAERPENTERLISLFCRENDANLRRLILQLYRFLRALPYRKNWYTGVISRLRSGEMSREVLDWLDRTAKEEARLIRPTVKRLRALAGSLKCHSAAQNVLYYNCDLAEAAIETLGVCPRESGYELIRGLKWKNLPGRQSKTEAENTTQHETEIYEAAKTCNGQMKTRLTALTEYYEADAEKLSAEQNEVADSFEELCLLCEKLDAEVLQMKIERNAVDFADTELISVGLLTECSEDGVIKRTPLAEEIVSSKRYRVILIDEFQDVNNLQEVIFKAISDTDDLSEIGKNVFVVGDVKQAIYRFRQANPLIFTKTREQGRSPNSSVRELLLRKNFRSRGSVLDFCNYIFRSLMSKSLGETDYTDSEALVRGSEFISPDPPTEIIVTATGEEGASFESEFTAVARRIRQLIDEKTPVNDGGAERPCRPSDFCVLTRNNVTGSDLAEIFSKEGLKILANDTSGYLKSREISVLLNLLAVISDPMQDIALASVLLSPIVGFSDDELALLRIFSREDRLYKTLLAVSKGKFDADGGMVEKCRGFVALLKRLSVLASGMTLTRLIRRIYDITDIFALASAYEDGEQKCANLYLLLEYARSYEESSPDGLAGFLRFIDYIQKSGGDFEQALTSTESADAVTVKTVHRSKGLEYPFVFICQTGKRFNKTDLNGALQLNSRSGAGFTFFDYGTLTKKRTEFWKYVRSTNESELLSEELRLLYVAMTRAKERLFILLDLSKDAIKNVAGFSQDISFPAIPAAVSQRASCTADWLMMALSGHPQFGLLRSALGTEARTDTAIYPEISVIPAPSGQGSEVAPSSDEARPDPALVKKLRDSFGAVTESRLTENEAKLTVSEIVKDDALRFFPKVPSLGDSLEELSAAQRGTVTHRFMQFCDFDSASRGLEGEIERLRLRGVFTEKEAAAIDRRSVGRFFESGIYSRIRRARSVLREKRFIVRFDDIALDDVLGEIYRGTDGMLQGVADCLFEEDDGFVLVDYKTDRVDSAESLAEKYMAQLTLYKAAFDVLLDKPVKLSYIYSFRLGEGIELNL